jgi:small-conductance mechanosensitive channel
MGSFGTYLVDMWDVFSDRGATVIVLQLLLMAAAGIAAFFVHRHSHKAFSERLQHEGLSVTHRLLLDAGQRLALPLSGLFAVLLGRLAFSVAGFETPLLDAIAQLLIALAFVRLIVFSLRVGFSQGPALKAWEKVISTSIWVIVALHLVGWLPVVESFMEQLAFTAGDSRFSFLMLVKFVMFSAFYLLLALWLSGFLEKRMKKSPHINISMRVGLAKVSRVFLLFVAFMLALTEAGLNLSSLAVFGGALGVGLGFGLQKIVSNFISGFILLGDRSIRPGDVISVGDTYGWVKELRARYIVVRNRDGVETLIPNENLVTSDVINWSYSDRRVRVRIPVQISYRDDPEQAMAIMEKAATASDRVLKTPEPVVRLMEFADSGIALELRVWLTDPEEGVGNVQSDVNLAIWHGFKEAGITIPYPQRDVHLRQVEMVPAGGN